NAEVGYRAKDLLFMVAGLIEDQFRQLSTLYHERKHEEALDLLDSISVALPASPLLNYQRAQNLSTLGMPAEARASCEQLLRRLGQSRTDLDAVAELLIPQELALLEEAIEAQESQINVLKSSLSARIADALDKATLQAQIEKLQAQLDAARQQAQE